LNYLHNIKIVHRDIKLENLVFINKMKGKVTTEEI
jgi:serine/threonine protein kinase